MSLADVFERRARYCVEPCDCRFGLASMPSDSVDAIVCDPPYGLGFMGKQWDSFSPERTAERVSSKRRKAEANPGGRGELAACIPYDRTRTGNQAFQQWVMEWAIEAFRVAKPGAHLVAFGGTRTYHRLVCAIEDAGWEIRDSLCWLYGSGFPKSLNVSKAIDAALGAERELVASTGQRCGVFAHSGNGTPQDITKYQAVLSAPASDEAKRADGYGTALKPAFEPIVLARKPLGDTVAATFMRYGTGALNIDGCRIAAAPDDADKLAAGVEAIRARGGTMENSWKNSSDLSGANPASPLGRWPANVLLSHTEWCEVIGTIAVRGMLAEDVIERWHCAPDCPVRLLDDQAGDSPSTPYRENSATGAVLPLTLRTAGGFSDTGGPSRFFYTSKASRAERDAGLEDFEPRTAGEATDRNDETAGLNSPRSGAGRTGGARNIHPTVKPVELMRWLVRLVGHPGALILDPFTGSGTTGKAAMLEGMRFVGLELEPLHVDFARARIAHVVGGAWEREIKPERPIIKRQPGLFDEVWPCR